MSKKAFAFLVLVVLAGCSNVGINVSHVRTTAGFVNSSLVDAGALFQLDLTKGHEKAEKIGFVPLSDKKSGRTFASFKAGSVVGLGVDGNIGTDDLAKIETAVKASGYVEMTNVTAVEYRHIFSALSEAINRPGAVDQDLAAEWSLMDAAAPDSPLRLLLVYETYDADTAKFGYDNSALVGGTMRLSNGFWGGVDVKISGLDVQSFIGKGVPVLVNYYVIKVSLERNADGRVTYHFTPDRSFDLDTLPGILRH